MIVFQTKPCKYTDQYGIRHDAQIKTVQIELEKIDETYPILYYHQIFQHDMAKDPYGGKYVCDGDSWRRLSDNTWWSARLYGSGPLLEIGDPNAEED